MELPMLACLSAKTDSHQIPPDSVRATVVGRDAVLAGDPKMFRLLCNTNLNMKIPSRGSEEERIRIPCGYGLILN